MSARTRALYAGAQLYLCGTHSSWQYVIPVPGHTLYADCGGCNMLQMRARIAGGCCTVFIVRFVTKLSAKNRHARAETTTQPLVICIGFVKWCGGGVRE